MITEKPIYEDSTVQKNENNAWTYLRYHKDNDISKEWIYLKKKEKRKQKFTWLHWRQCIKHESIEFSYVNFWGPCFRENFLHFILKALFKYFCSGFWDGSVGEGLSMKVCGPGFKSPKDMWCQMLWEVWRR